MIMDKIGEVIHDDTRYQKGTLNMRTQKCFAVKVCIMDINVYQYLTIAYFLTSLRSMVRVAVNIMCSVVRLLTHSRFTGCC